MGRSRGILRLESASRVAPRSCVDGLDVYKPLPDLDVACRSKVFPRCSRLHLKPGCSRFIIERSLHASGITTPLGRYEFLAGLATVDAMGKLPEDAICGGMGVAMDSYSGASLVQVRRRRGTNSSLHRKLRDWLPRLLARRLDGLPIESRGTLEVRNSKPYSLVMRKQREAILLWVEQVTGDRRVRCRGRG